MKKIIFLLLFSTLLQTNAQCVRSVSASIYTSFVIKSDGTLWGCGGNFHGMVGDGTTTDRNAFTQIGSDNNWKTISAGESHSLALKLDGTLWAWGYNFFGELGDGTNTDKIVPTQIGTANDWKAISATYWSNFSIKE